MEPAWDPVSDNLGLNRTYAEGAAAIEATISALGRLNLPPEMLSTIAFAIAGEDVPEEETREALREEYALEKVELGRVAMKALDGGYTALWAAAAERAKTS